MPGKQVQRKASVVLTGLADWRIERLLTQMALSEAAKVAISTVKRAEAGGPASPLIAKKLATALGVSVDDLRQRKPNGAKANA